MNIAVVGAGFTGCMAALHAARRGAAVTLYETAPQIGGVLRDVDVEGQRYFNGCQYLREPALAELGLTEGLVKFPHEYGSLTALGQPPRLLDDCAQPALDGEADIQPSPIEGTALERLQAYGRHAPALIEWARGFGDLARLDHRCVVPMQISRAYFPDDARLREKKAASAQADRLIALPRRLRLPGQPAEPAWLPEGGFDALFDRLGRALAQAGVQVRSGSPVKLSEGANGWELYSRGQAERFERVVWASNPTAVLKRLCGLDLRTPPILMRLLVGDLDADSAPVPLPYYWQVFDAATPVVRVYVYRLQGRLRFSVEAFDRGDEGEARQALAPVFAALGLPTGHTVAAVLPQQRHVNFSSEEMAAMEAATPTLLSHGIIPGGWCHYGREEKVAHMKRLLDEALA